MDSSMRLGAFAGVALFLLTLIEFPLVFVRYLGPEFISGYEAYSSLVTASTLVLELFLLVAGIIMYYGFVLLSKKSGNVFLGYISVFLILQVALMALGNGIDILNPEMGLIDGLILFGLMFIEGISYILFGAFLLKEKKAFGNIALAAGCLNIFTGLLDATILLYILGVLLFIPTVLLNSYLLYQAAKKY